MRSFIHGITHVLVRPEALIFARITLKSGLLCSHVCYNFDIAVELILSKQLHLLLHTDQQQLLRHI